jgi:hypothetical protein
VKATPVRDGAPTLNTDRRPLSTGAALRLAGLVVGDAVAFLIFAGLGRGQHQEATGLGALGEVALTALPFALGWFVVAPLLGAFRRTVTSQPRAMLGRTALAWLAAWPVALLLRWAFTGRVPPVSFALVTLVANTIILSLWRGTYALVARRKKA